MSKYEKFKKVIPDIWLIYTIIGFCLVMVDLFLSPTNLIFKWVTNVVAGTIALVFVIKLSHVIGCAIKTIYRKIKE